VRVVDVALTVTVWVDDELPALFVAVSVTVNVPTALKTCIGSWTVDTGLPSPKFQLHEVGAFVEASVNATGRGTSPEPGDRVNEATGARIGAATVTVNALDVLLPPAFVAVNRTLKTPPLLNVCDGSCVVTNADPSPKSQLHDAGVFVDVSVKSTTSGASPDAAEAVNDASGTGTGSETTTVWVTLLDPAVFVAVNVTS
jgi:hypothetical protein